MTEINRDALFQVGVLGKQVEEFWSSDLGQFLLSRVEEELEQAVAGLKAAPPTDVAQITRLQGMAWRADSFRNWLSEAISAGLNAVQILDERDEE